MDYSGKLVLITGGSSGIGLALARDFFIRGASLCLLARHLDQLESAKADLLKYPHDIAQSIDILPADVSSDSEITKNLDTYFSRAGTPDYLINGAGVAHPGLFQELDNQIFRWMMEVNYLGTVYCTKAVIHRMIKRKSGHIVNISSIAGYLGVYGYTAYGASKFAIRGFSDALRAEMKQYGIKVSIVFPPDTKTPQLDYENQYKPNVTKELAGSEHALAPEIVSQAIIKGISRGKYIINIGEGKFIFPLANLMGELTYPLMDAMIKNIQNKQHD